VSKSKRAKRKRKAEEDEKASDAEQIVSGKVSRQILAMAREQQDEAELEEEEESEGEDQEMKWRENRFALRFCLLMSERTK